MLMERIVIDYIYQVGERVVNAIIRIDFSQGTTCIFHITWLNIYCLEFYQQIIFLVKLYPPKNKLLYLYFSPLRSLRKKWFQIALSFSLTASCNLCKNVCQNSHLNKSPKEIIYLEAHTYLLTNQFSYDWTRDLPRSDAYLGREHCSIHVDRAKCRHKYISFSYYEKCKFIFFLSLDNMYNFSSLHTTD